MKHPFPLLVVSLLISWCTSLQAQHSKLTSANEPAWITVNNISHSFPDAEKEAEDGYLDMGYERQISLATQETFYKKHIKVLSDAGVQNASEISLDFDPAYEKLILHSIYIIREGKKLNRLQLSKFRVIQRETDLSLHLYDGSLTALLVLDDVRKGDIIVSSYPLRGFNPIFKGKYSDAFYCRYGVPIPHLYYKLVVPFGQSLTMKNSQTDIAPAISKSGSETIYEWKISNAKGVDWEKNVPGWFNPYPHVMVSEFNSWSEVSAWAAALFPGDIQLSPALQKKISSIKSSCRSDEERTGAALHFVQDEIRYMGIEMGENSHKPAHPNKVFTQRFGDCKDKSYLLVTMLKSMGIDAYPVLINTDDKKSLTTQLPAANLFDHVTVQAIVNGKVYWFDPTISFQRGSLQDISYPDYQAGLVVHEASKELSVIPFREPGSAEIKEIFTLADMSGAATLKVVSSRTGSSADDARYEFYNNSISEIKKKYKDFYAAYFNSITADSLGYQDDEVSGVFTTVEYYTIKDIWELTDGKKTLSFSPFVISSVMSKPDDKNRTMPYDLLYPSKYREVIEMNMPEDWTISDVSKTITSSAFTFSMSGSSVGKKVTFVYDYENTKDHVPAAEIGSYVSRYDEVFSSTGYELTYNESAGIGHPDTNYSNSVSLSLFPKLYIVLGLAVIITFLVRRQRQGGF